MEAVLRVPVKFMAMEKRHRKRNIPAISLSSNELPVRKKIKKSQLSEVQGARGPERATIGGIVQMVALYQCTDSELPD